MIPAGTKVRIVATGLATLASIEAHDYEADIVTAGTEATYFRGVDRLPEWHWLTVEVAGRDLFVPARVEAFEVIVEADDTAAVEHGYHDGPAYLHPDCHLCRDQPRGRL